MSDSRAATQKGKSDADQAAAADELKTDASQGADRRWPDEATVVPDPYLTESER